jgi:hypothetical protein
MKLKVVLVLSLTVLGQFTITNYERILEKGDRQIVQTAWNGQLLKMKALRPLGTNINVYPVGRATEISRSVVEVLALKWPRRTA